MPVHDPIAQRAERVRATASALTPVTVLLNDTVLAAVDRFVDADTGIGKRLDREMVVAMALNDFLHLGRIESFLGVGPGASGRIDDGRFE